MRAKNRIDIQGMVDELYEKEKVVEKNTQVRLKDRVKFWIKEGQAIPDNLIPSLIKADIDRENERIR